MNRRYYIGWVRDGKGFVVRRPPKYDMANAVTTMCGGAHIGKDGLGNTTPYVVYEFE